MSVAVGDRVWFSLAFSANKDFGSPALETADAEVTLAGTLEYWQKWSAACTYSGPYHDLVRRSALVLKLLTFQPSGALIAAPTTSLPEVIGGVRNWDLRYTWLRDSALILDTLQRIGYHEESMRFFDWLEGLCLCDHGDLQIMCTVKGDVVLPEQTLNHLEGYRGSQPVRIGQRHRGAKSNLTFMARYWT